MISLGPFDTLEQLVNAAITLLRAEGLVVSESRDDWESVGEMRERHGIRSASQFSERLQHPECPHFQKITGATGRILKLKSNDALDAFINHGRKNA